MNNQAVLTPKPKMTHLEHIQRYRKSEDYRNNENKSKILRRIAQGSIPNVKSLEKYDITPEDINVIRKANGLPETGFRIPYYMKERNKERVTTP